MADEKPPEYDMRPMLVMGTVPNVVKLRPVTCMNTAFPNFYKSKKPLLSPYSWGFCNVNKLLRSKKSHIYQLFSKKGVDNPSKICGRFAALVSKETIRCSPEIFTKFWRCLYDQKRNLLRNRSVNQGLSVNPFSPRCIQGKKPLRKKTGTYYYTCNNVSIVLKSLIDGY